MSESTRSLLTLLGLIFTTIGVFIVVVLWWVNRSLDEVFDQDKQHLHD